MHCLQAFPRDHSSGQWTNEHLFGLFFRNLICDFYAFGFIACWWFFCLFFPTALPPVKTVVPLVSPIKGKIPARQVSVQCLPIQNVNSSGIHSAPDCPVPQCASTFSPCFLLLYAHREVSVSHLPVRNAAQRLRLRLRLRLSAGVRQRAHAPSLPELK